MAMKSFFYGLTIALSMTRTGVTAANENKPNIVVIMADDQDARLESLDAQPYIRDVLAGEGVVLENHFATVAQCCPSRTSFLRGQAAHNTNLTHVKPPGGAYDKFVYSGQDQNYLPHWLKAAGYRTEYIGKFMNGFSMATYNKSPRGWDHTDILVEPYIYEFNNVVMSKDGERPVFYDGYHQTDVIRAKALATLEDLSESGDPFYYQIAPAAPHSQPDGPAVPCSRHMWSYNSAMVPRTPNFNPPDKWQSMKPFWLKDLHRLNESETDFVDWQHRSRLQAMLGIDEMVNDIVNLLREKDILENTYIIYTSDNGFHLGHHRQVGGKGLPYIEDTNIPMIVRGPGIPGGTKSTIPSTHVDMAPTFLEIAGLCRTSKSYPPFLDGRSLLEEWQSPLLPATPKQEIVSVEFWGTISNSGNPNYKHGSPVYSYKTIRIVSAKASWLFSRWCDGNTTELYNTKSDPYELNNLAVHPSPREERIIERLNGLLLVVKSCSEQSCRDPWSLLSEDADGDFASLDEALDPKYDGFFSSLPSVGYSIGCMDYQWRPNESPYYPPESIALGSQYRNDTDNFVTLKAIHNLTPGNSGRMGSIQHRHVTLNTILKTAREVTDAEIGHTKVCEAPDYCTGSG